MYCIVHYTEKSREACLTSRALQRGLDVDNMMYCKNRINHQADRDQCIHGRGPVLTQAAPTQPPSALPSGMVQLRSTA